MAMGLPIITTNWSGTTEFINSANAYPLPLDSENPLVHPKHGPFQSHLWGNPSLESLRTLLSHLPKHQEEGKKKGLLAYRDMRTKWSPDAVADVLVSRLRALTTSPPTHPIGESIQ